MGLSSIHPPSTYMAKHYAPAPLHPHPHTYASRYAPVAPVSYGHSEGSPSEKGIHIDVQTALDYLTSHPIFNSPQGNAEHVSNIIIYGQSIGSGVGLDLAAQNSHAIRGIILENSSTP
ncbi:hypothetical protein BU17DRAFT_64797 [Hysterangium stoloniferum]|nr:hypothetical protein BU17DRAFT_64797 [Hysterangium stoloniferum]